MQITLKQLKGLLKTLEDGGATEFEYQDEKYRVRLALGRGPLLGGQLRRRPHRRFSRCRPVLSPTRSRPSPRIRALRSSRRRSSALSIDLRSPDSEPFVDVGKAVREGQTLCIVEAMKLMNEIEAEFAGTIVEILVENGKQRRVRSEAVQARRSLTRRP